MKHFADPEFWKAYQRLPGTIRKQADKKFEFLKNNATHPSLHFKPVGRYWSARVNLDYRALAVKDGVDFIWFWIGRHSEYDQLLG